ncbi:unnamed protein product [Rangifer tarandus platyrhynchus]|uniref:Uncharacterized protein n=1 Tax=Rangifer tarandus platyrhynchus TaxID=3082113 RepID=A0AC59ZWE1_RANTA
MCGTPLWAVIAASEGLERRLASRGEGGHPPHVAVRGSGRPQPRSRWAEMGPPGLKAVFSPWSSRGRESSGGPPCAALQNSGHMFFGFEARVPAAGPWHFSGPCTRLPLSLGSSPCHGGGRQSPVSWAKTRRRHGPSPGTEVFPGPACWSDGKRGQRPRRGGGLAGWRAGPGSEVFPCFLRLRGWR